MTPALYRVGQFWNTCRAAAPTTDQLSPARDALTPAQMALFSKMQVSEQIHSLRVLQVLSDQGETHPDLIVAALLHDVGKTRSPLRLWERIFVVLGKAFFPQSAKTWGDGFPRGWRRPFVVAQQHPLWGADFSLEAGTAPLAVSLIRRHQENSPPLNTLEDRLLAALQNADNRS